MHPITQSILVVGVLALVGINGYVAVNGLPEKGLSPVEKTTRATNEILCSFYLTTPIEELGAEGRARRAKCLLD